jgi:ABC-type sugar transport system substrate-binding protein
MDPKQRENGREREEARERDEEAQAIGKAGAKSLAKKTGSVRHDFEPHPAARPVEGAFGHEDRATGFDDVLAETGPEPKLRGRGGTGVGRDLDH